MMLACIISEQRKIARAIKWTNELLADSIKIVCFWLLFYFVEKGKY